MAPETPTSYTYLPYSLPLTFASLGGVRAKAEARAKEKEKNSIIFFALSCALALPHPSEKNDTGSAEGGGDL
ncbi:MAG: hypothetical protein IME94_04035 [Proteobacteria bacterium]|nr:hypothetical protein [Pseudomonadota bacterium]